MKRKLVVAWANLTHDSDRSVGFPLYRILALFLLPPGILQLALQRVPESIQETTPSWYDMVFITLQLLGAVLVIVSLAMGDTQDSSRLERIAAWVLGGTGVIYIIALWAYTWPGIPLTTPTWMYQGFVLFCGIRIAQLNRKLDRFERLMEETAKEAE